MKREDFDYVSNTLRERSGLILTVDKGYLLESRLLPVARKWRFADLDALCGAMRRDPAGDLVRNVVEAMTTNESFFFRDGKPFTQFRELVLPRLMKTRRDQKRIRIWSAACSTGQEPYSVAMTLADMSATLAGWHIEILGTDISNEVLERAKSGEYSQFEVQRGLPIALLLKYFNQEGERWRVAAGIRSMVTFRHFNLLDDMHPLGTFDVIFCRNVLIYFDQAAKSGVFSRLANLMPVDGVLYLGGAETVVGVTDRFVPMAGKSGMYELVQYQEPARAAL